MYCPTILPINLKAVLAASFIVTTTAMPLVLNSAAVAQDRGQKAQSEAATFPTTERMEERLAFEMFSGEIDQTQADMLLRLHARLTAGIESGKLSAPEAMEMLVKRATPIYEGDTGAKDNKGGKSKVDAKKRYEEAIANMTEMVKNGEITREQMEQRIDGMKKRMKAGAKNEQTIAKREYEKAIANMTEMVKNGEITREQMEQRINRMKKRMANKKTITREDIAEANTKMQKMVEAGEITEEQMQQRLNEMRRMMRSQLGNQRDARAEYKRMESRLMKAVEAGKMSQEEADQKLEGFGKELRAKAARGEEEAKEEIADDCRALGMRLRQAVADGEMTGEEARAAWERACGGKDR